MVLTPFSDCSALQYIEAKKYLSSSFPVWLILVVFYWFQIAGAITNSPVDVENSTSYIISFICEYFKVFSLPTKEQKLSNHFFLVYLRTTRIDGVIAVGLLRVLLFIHSLSLF
jgi:hypothetical protein